MAITMGADGRRIDSDAITPGEIECCTTCARTITARDPWGRDMHMDLRFMRLTHALHQARGAGDS